MTLDMISDGIKFALCEKSPLSYAFGFDQRRVCYRLSFHLVAPLFVQISICLTFVWVKYDAILLNN